MSFSSENKNSSLVQVVQDIKYTELLPVCCCRNGSTGLFMTFKKGVADELQKTEEYQIQIFS